jgi:hypothetical protein
MAPALVQSLRKYVFTVDICTATKILIYVFPEKELRDLSPNFHIHVSASDHGNVKIAHGHMIVKIGTEAAHFLFWEVLFQIFGIVSLQCAPRFDKRSHTKYVTGDILQYRTGLSVHLVKPVITSGPTLNPDPSRFSGIKIPSKLSSLSYVEKLNVLPGSGTKINWISLHPLSSPHPFKLI